MLSNILARLLALIYPSSIPLISLSCILYNNLKTESSTDFDEVEVNLGFSPPSKIGKEILASILLPLQDMLMW